MTINFDALPGEKPISLPDPGTYYFKIEKPHMKAPKDSTKPNYLNMQLALKTSDGRSAGKIFDIITESDHELMRYKLQRFIKALGIPITGQFELKDLPKIVEGKEGICDISHQESEQYPTKAQIDIFSGDIYYPLSMAKELFQLPADDDTPFTINESDAVDADKQAPAPDDTDY